VMPNVMDPNDYGEYERQVRQLDDSFDIDQIAGRVVPRSSSAFPTHLLNGPDDFETRLEKIAKEHRQQRREARPHRRLWRRFNTWLRKG
jgi:hypothetical protein